MVEFVTDMYINFSLCVYNKNIIDFLHKKVTFKLSYKIMEEKEEKVNYF